MHTSRLQKIMVWRKSQQSNLWTNWIYFNPDFVKLTILDGGLWKEFQQMQVRSLPRRNSKKNDKLADLVWR